LANSTTATVETLTAEVRVLMVGSRQVTLSVYGQLDFIDSARIEPFGRVNPRGRRSSHIYVVGKNIETGELARSYTPVDETAIGPSAVSALEKSLGLAHGTVPEHQIVAEMARLKKRGAEWSALPLIVLAGLR